MDGLPDRCSHSADDVARYEQEKGPFRTDQGVVAPYISLRWLEQQNETGNEIQDLETSETVGRSGNTNKKHAIGATSLCR